jgi:hypothetical protein
LRTVLSHSTDERMALGTNGVYDLHGKRLCFER